MSKIVFDIETDNLLDTATTVWCICTRDIKTGAIEIGIDKEYLPIESPVPVVPMQKALDTLANASILIGHNVVGFDLHILQKFYGLSLFHKKIRDTLCMSKLFQPERPSHSLESYGVQFDRPKPVHEVWSEISSEMLVRCSEDVEINAITYDWMVSTYCKDWDWVQAIELEQKFLYWQVMQEQEGVNVDVALAKDLVNRLDKEVAEIDMVLMKRLPKRCVPVGAPVLKPFKKDGTLIKRVTEWISG